MSRHDDRVRILHMLDYAREAVEISSGKTVDDLRDDRLRSLALTHLFGTGWRSSQSCLGRDTGALSVSTMA